MLKGNKIMVDITKKLKEDKIDYIQYQFTDLLGKFKEVEFPAIIWDDRKEGTGRRK